MADKQSKSESMNTNLYILKALENGEKYGYEIIDSVNKISYNKLEIKQATLYSTLKRLEQKKLINSYWKDSDIGGKRHYYFITDTGRKFLTESNYNFSTFGEIINEELDKEPKKDLNIELIDSNSLNNKGSKAFWSENKYFASKMLKEEQNNPINKIIQQQQQKKVEQSSKENIKEEVSVARQKDNNVEIFNIDKSNKVDENEKQETLVENTNESTYSVDESIEHTPSATIYLRNENDLDVGNNEPKSNLLNKFDKSNDKNESAKDNSGKKYDAVILGQDEKIESNEEAYSMQNRPLNSIAQTADIDYKNILGELYSDKESFYARNNSSKNEYSKNAMSVGDEITHQYNSTVNANVNNFEDVNYSDNEYFDGENSNIEKFNNVGNNLNKEQQQIKLRTIANNFANYKIKVKPHNKLYKVDINSEDFIKTSKLNFISSIINFAFYAILIVISGYCLSNSQITDSDNVFKICLGIGAIYPIIMLVMYLFSSEKKAKNSFNFKNTLTITALSCLVVMIFIIAICLLCGMTNLNQAKYIYFWLIPAILSLSVVAYSIIKELLIKSKKFNC